MNRRSDIRRPLGSAHFTDLPFSGWNRVPRTLFLTMVILLIAIVPQLEAQQPPSQAEVEEAMMKATHYMVEEVSTHGGYLRLYTEDFSRQWAELEAFDTQIQLTYGKTPSMGHLFLDLYRSTGEEYYYRAAEKVVEALIWGQHESGGWDYMIDFAGSRSLKKWHKTIGQNAWGWPEYHNYYGIPTFKNGTTIEAARYLLRIYLEKLDPAFKPALDKAIQFVLDSQFPLGGWPQRYPAGPHYTYNGKSDYVYFYVFNDYLTWENIEFLIQAYHTLGEERFLDPIRRGMNFYLITQQGNPQAGWGEQYTMDLEPAHGRPYEPAALMPGATYRKARLLMMFYRYTGDRKFLARIPDAIDWLRRSKLPEHMTKGGKRTHAGFMEVGTNRPLWNHRRGTGVLDGEYIVNYDYEGVDGKIYGYGDNIRINIDELEREYERVAAMSPEEASRNSPLKVERYKGMEPPQRYLEFRNSDRNFDPTPEPVYTAPSESEVRQILDDLDGQGRWITTGEWISDPYTVDEEGNPSNTALYSDPITAAWITDDSDQEYISTQVYIDNMRQLLEYIKQESDQ